MKQVGQKGFTIIETLLFMAMASLMLLIAVNAIGSKNQRVQFTDGVRALEVFLERQYDNIRNGTIDQRVNCSWDGANFTLNSTASDGSCIFMGFAFEFGDYSLPPGNDLRTQITVHQLVGGRLTNSQLQACVDAGEYDVNCAQPTASGVTFVYDIPWGIEIFGGAFDTYDTQSFALLRRPSSTAIVPVFFLQGSDHTDTGIFDKTNNSITVGGTRASAIEDGSANFCIKSADNNILASLNVSESFRQESFEIAYENTAEFSPLCGSSGRFNGNR